VLVASTHVEPLKYCSRKLDEFKIELPNAAADAWEVTPIKDAQSAKTNKNNLILISWKKGTLIFNSPKVHED
jgi:hypothetical protein